MSEEKVVRRGEVWWISAGITVGAEVAMGRPGVIVSSDTGNEKSKTVIVAYVTTKLLWGNVTPKVRVGDKSRWVLCHQLASVDRSRLERKDGVLTPEDMAKVDAGLTITLDVTTKPEPKQEEPADVVALRCERDMWKGMYDKVLEMLVDQRVTVAVEQKTAVVAQKTEEPVVKQEKPPVVKREKPPVVKRDERLLVDINHCSELALRELGLSDADATKIIECRPYESVLELNCVPDLDTGWVVANEHLFVCTPVVVDEVKKVNINTCVARDLMALGMDKNRVYKITSHRKKNGPFALVGDLVNVAGISQKWLDQWIDKLEV